MDDATPHRIESAFQEAREREGRIDAVLQYMRLREQYMTELLLEENQELLEKYQEQLEDHLIDLYRAIEPERTVSSSGAGAQTADGVYDRYREDIETMMRNSHSSSALVRRQVMRYAGSEEQAAFSMEEQGGQSPSDSIETVRMRPGERHPVVIRLAEGLKWVERDVMLTTPTIHQTIQSVYGSPEDYVRSRVREVEEALMPHDMMREYAERVIAVDELSPEEKEEALSSFLTEAVTSYTGLLRPMWEQRAEDVFASHDLYGGIPAEMIER